MLEKGVIHSSNVTILFIISFDFFQFLQNLFFFLMIVV